MRPQRLYKTDAGRYYFIIDGKRKYIKIPKGMTEAELMKLNTKTILQTFGRRLKKRKKRKAPKFEKPIINGELGKKLSIDNEKTASSAFVQQGKPITEIAEVLASAKTSEETKKGFQKLIDVAGKSMQGLLKGSTLKKQKTIKQPTDIEEETKKPTNKQQLLILDKEIDAEIKQTIAEGNKKRTLGKKRGAEPNIRPSTLYKIMLQRQLKGQKIPTLEEANQLVNSKFLDLSPEIYKKAITLLETRLKAKDIASMKRDTLSQFISDIEVETENPPTAEETSSDDNNPIIIKKKGKKEEPPVPEPPAPEPAPKKRKQTKVGETPEGADIIIDETASDSVAEQVDKSMGLSTGGGVEEGGLYNDEIAKIIRKRVGKIVPVIPIDKVNSLLKYVVKGDKKFAAVVNTNPSTSDGSGTDGYRPGHWRGIYINNEDDYPSIEYFDPLVEGPPESQLVSVMRKLCKKIAPEKMCLYKQNAIRRQAKEKSTCGWHTLQFIDDRWNGVPWSEATGYDNYIENLPGPVDDSVDGEADVSKYIKKYKIYL
jgi:hypothetical protein